MKAACSVLVLAFAVLTIGTAVANPIPEGYAGMDQNGDFQCSAEEMGFELGAVNQGQVFTTDVFFDMIGGGVLSFGCTFCVQDKFNLSDEAFFYATPASWTASTMKNSDEHLILISPWILAAYPDVRCYSVEATDFTFAEAMIAPFTLGTFQFTYAAAEDDCVGFVIDGANTGFLTSGFMTGTMGFDGQTCPPFECSGTSSTESESWGGVKALFR